MTRAAAKPSTVRAVGESGKALDELCRAFAAVSAASSDGKGTELAASAVLDGALRHGRALLEHDLEVSARIERLVNGRKGARRASR